MTISVTIRELLSLPPADLVSQLAAKISVKKQEIESAKETKEEIKEEVKQMDPPIARDANAELVQNLTHPSVSKVDEVKTELHKRCHNNKGHHKVHNHHHHRKSHGRHR